MLTDLEHRVLDVVGSEEVIPLGQMACDAGMSMMDLKKVLKNLITLGLVEFGTCHCGSGYWLNTAGARLRGD